MEKGKIIGYSCPGTYGAESILDIHGQLVLTIRDEDAAANMPVARAAALAGDWLFPGSICCIAGAPKAGKTNLAIPLAHHLARGTDYLGWSIPQKCIVILAEAEEGATAQGHRYERMADALDAAGDTYVAGAEFSRIEDAAVFEFGRDVSGSIRVDPMKGLARQVKAAAVVARARLAAAGEDADRPVVAFFDTLTVTVPGLGGGRYDHDAQIMKAVNNWFAEQGFCGIFLHHTNQKNSDVRDVTKDVSGTNGIAGGFDSLLNVYRDFGLTPEEEDMNEAAGKSGPKIKPHELPSGEIVMKGRLTAGTSVKMFLNDAGFWELDDLADVQEPPEPPEWLDGVVDLVASRPAAWSGTATDLARELGLSIRPNKLSQTLKKWAAELADRGVGWSTTRTPHARVITLTRLAGQEVIDLGQPS